MTKKLLKTYAVKIYYGQESSALVYNDDDYFCALKFFNHYKKLKEISDIIFWSYKGENYATANLRFLKECRKIA